MTIVVIDTNVFVRHTYLCRKQRGHVLMGLLRSTGGKLYIPEILRREYFEQTQAMVDEHAGEIRKNRDALKTLIGHQDASPLPDVPGIQGMVEKRLQFLAPISLMGPTIDELMQAAGRRSIDKLPPSTKSDHGLKDCLIWEAILQLPPGSKVWLASNDHGFFKDKTDELHPHLLEEARAREIEVSIVRTLERIVDAISKENPDLELSIIEKRELAEQGDIFSVTPPPAPADPVLAVLGPTGDLDKVSAALTALGRPFEDFELRVFGYIAFLDPVLKSDLFEALAGSGIQLEVAENVADRLVLFGLIRDSGTHYLIVSKALSEEAAAAVEPEIIAWLAKRRPGDE
jgi:hypothetical protein